jgi:hypothetical protein
MYQLYSDQRLFAMCPYTREAVVVVIVWYLDVQLPVQSLPITSNVGRQCILITTLCDKVCQ